MALGTPGTWYASWGTPLVPWDLKGIGAPLRAWGVTSGPLGPPRAWGSPQGLWDPPGTWHVLGEHPWSHGISRALENPKDLSLGETLYPGDTSRPWGPSGTRPVPGGHLCSIRPPKGMFQVISGGLRTWGSPWAEGPPRGFWGCSRRCPQSPGDTGVPSGHHPGIPSVGPVPGGDSAAAGPQPGRVGAAAATCQCHHLPHREPQRPGGTLRRGTTPPVVTVTIGTMGMGRCSPHC